MTNLIILPVQNISLIQKIGEECARILYKLHKRLKANHNTG